MNAKYIAFFDVDETLIHCKTMLSFLKFFYEKKSANRFIANIKYRLFYFLAYVHVKRNKSRELLNRCYYKRYAGTSMQYLNEISREWFNKVKKEFSFNEKIVAELKMHQENSAEIVFVSGSFPPCLNPIAEHFNVPHILSIHLEEKEGKITGNIIPPQTIGEGKAIAMKKFLQKYPDISSNDCFAYGDHGSDLPMLMAVGYPTVVGNDKLLAKHAKENHWKIIN